MHVCRRARDNRCVFQRRAGGALQPANIYMLIHERVKGQRRRYPSKGRLSEKKRRSRPSLRVRKVRLTVVLDQNASHPVTSLWQEGKEAPAAFTCSPPSGERALHAFTRPPRLRASEPRSAAAGAWVGSPLGGGMRSQGHPQIRAMRRKIPTQMCP